MTKLMSFVFALVFASFTIGAQEVPVRDFPQETPTATATPKASPTPATNAVATAPEKEESWPWWMLPLGILSGLLAVGGGIYWWFFWRKPKEKPASRRPIGHEPEEPEDEEPPHHHRGGGHGGAATALLLGLTLVSQVWAQTPAPAPTATPAKPSCEVVKVIGENTVVRSVPNPVTKPAEVKFQIAVRGCETPAVKELQAAAKGVTFALAKEALKSGVLTAKVVITTDAETGPARLRLVLADGTKILAPESAHVVVLSTEAAAVRKTAAEEVRRASSVANKAAKDVVTLRSELARVETDLERKLEKHDNDNESFEKRLAALETRVAQGETRDESRDRLINEGIIPAMAENAADIATVAKTEVKKGIFKKRPIDTDVAKRAAERRKMILSEEEEVEDKK